MVPCAEIIIGKLKFTAASEINIKKSWKNFTGTASIKLPKAIYYDDGSGVYKKVKHIGDYIKVGDKVEIKLGYNRQLFTEFLAVSYTHLDVYKRQMLDYKSVMFYMDVNSK